MKPNELPIYDEYQTPRKFEFVDEKVNFFRQGISSVRKTIWDYLDTIQDTTAKVKGKYVVARDHAKDGLHYIQEDSGVVPRAIIITVAGLGGIVAGYRGSNLRRAIYAGAAMTSAASICYPHQAVDISTNGWRKTKDWVRNLGQEGAGKVIVVKHPGKTDAPEKKEPSAPTDVKLVTPKGDSGQSNPADKDMYTTRS